MQGSGHVLRYEAATGHTLSRLELAVGYLQRHASPGDSNAAWGESLKGSGGKAILQKLCWPDVQQQAGKQQLTCMCQVLLAKCIQMNPTFLMQALAKLQ